MAKQAHVLDGTTRTALKFDTPAELLNKLKAKGWSSENGDVLLLANSDDEILFEKDLPDEDDLHLELRRRPTGKAQNLSCISPQTCCFYYLPLGYCWGWQQLRLGHCF